MKIDNAQVILEKQVLENKTPSVQYFFFDKDKIIKNFSFGHADLKSGQTVGPNNTYNAYSVTKTFTALAVLHLAEQGKIEIDSPVVNYLPDFPYGEGITIRHLLSHSAGIPNAIPLSWIHLAEEKESFDSKSFFMQIIEKNPKARTIPDEKFAYTNLGYVILGQLIEEVSGMPYEKFIIDNLIKKLDLGGYELAFSIQDNQRHARGYHKYFSFSNLILGLFINKKKFMDRREGKWKPFKPFYVNGAAYGGLIGSPVAFVKYIQELLKPDCALISADFKKLLFKENNLAGNKPSGMCLSWFTGKLNGVTYYAHAGGGGGYYCEIRIYPEKGLGSVVFFNRTGMTDERFLDKVDAEYITDEAQ